MTTPSALTALSPLDGRYGSRLQATAQLWSEQALIEARLRVEAHWLLHLAEHLPTPHRPELNQDCQRFLEQVCEQPSQDAANKVKAIEATTNHDVKAVEYYLRDELSARGANETVLAHIHFACTSEDINNTSYALMLANTRSQVLGPELDKLLHKLKDQVKAYQNLGMLSRTHGQTASPTTLGKEFAVFHHRLMKLRQRLDELPLEAKMNGAVGNYNAHVTSYPEVNWPELSHSFITQRLGLVQNPLTTQIENHDSMIDMVEITSRLCTICLGLARDMWSYISIGYFIQVPVEGEVGSSTMPHKINPIDFENAEGNFGLAIALGQHFATKLPISRWQRDLSDSTVQRSLGSFFGYALLGLASLHKGLSKVRAHQDLIQTDLEAAVEVLAEPIQTVMRRYGVVDAYEQLKAASRGKAVTDAVLQELITNCEALPDAAKAELKALRPSAYLGLASDLAATQY